MFTKDQRRFRRYCKGASELTLNYQNLPLKARIIDYSLDGLGLAIFDLNGTSMEKGDVLGYASVDPEMENFGVVAWSVKKNSSVRIGIRKVGPLRGHIRDFRLEDTLIGLQRSSKTGILTVTSGDVEKKVYVNNGDLIFSASNSDKDRLGDMLLRDGRLTKEQFDHSVAELKRTGQRQGGILVQLGYLTPGELVSAVTRQVERIIMDIFLMDKGTFEFKEMPLPTDEIITLKLSTANIIYYGIRSRVRPEQFMTQLPSGDAVISFASDPLNLFQDIKLDRSGKRIISCIDGKTTINDVLAITRMEKTEAHRIISALLGARVIEIKGADLTSTDEEEGLFVKEILEEAPSPTIDPQFVEMVDNMYGKLKTLNHYEILGIKPEASLPEIKAAYYKEAKRFHPDMHFYLTNESVKDKLSEIFISISLAYTILSSRPKREEYDTKTVKVEKIKTRQERAIEAFSEGKIQFWKTNYTEAERLFGQAIYYDGTIAEYQYYYGLLQAKTLKYKNAKKTLEVAHKLEPSNAEYMAELGFAYLGLGFTLGAKGFFERALKISFGNARAKEGLDQVMGQS